MSLESVQFMQSEWSHVSKWLNKIKTEDEYQSHLNDLETLIDEVGDNLKHPLSEFLDLLAMRVEEYEQLHFTIEDASSKEVLKFLMEQQGMSQLDLETKGFDQQGNISKILNGKREMNLGHIRMACQIFSVKADIFFRGPNG